MLLTFCVDSKIELKDFLIEKGFSNRITSKLLLEKKDIYINEKPYSNDFILMPKDIVKINLQEKVANVEPVTKDIEIIYEDEFFLAVNKPKDLATIPTKLHYKDNLAGRVLYYFNQMGISAGVHIVNRLDYMTSGIVVFAKSKYIHSLMSNIDIVKRYHCTICGVIAQKNGEITAKIDRIDNSIKRVVVDTGKYAKTLYNVILEKNGNSLLDVELKTGRTHQIRVHFSNIGHALVGDTLYGDGKGEFDLTSYYVSFFFPLNKKQYEFKI